MTLIEGMIREIMEEQVISKERVAEHGEVYTGRREVNAMLDLVMQETERIESRFLEPACGKGGGLVVRSQRLGVTRRRLFLTARVTDNVGLLV